MTRTDPTLNISNEVLTTIRDAANRSTVPEFMRAAQLTHDIHVATQGIKNNREGFLRLAKDACLLVENILLIRVDHNILNDVRKLLGILSLIQELARKERSRSFLLSLVKYKSDQRKIQEYRNSLRDFLQLFRLNLAISNQKDMLRVNGQWEIVMDLLDQSRGRTVGI